MRTLCGTDATFIVFIKSSKKRCALPSTGFADSAAAAIQLIAASL
jgi:hypothetical protein